MPIYKMSQYALKKHVVYVIVSQVLHFYTKIFNVDNKN